MSFTTEAEKSVNDARVLFELDITPVNTQWVNNGAGIWVYNLDKTYPWVDASLFDASWTDSDFTNVGSVRSDGANLVGVSGFDLSPLEYYWDDANDNLYICLQNYDEPALRDVRVGLVYGFSHTEFTPDSMVNSQPYEGRLSGAPRVQIARDPLFFGRISYGGGSIAIINQDGEYDTFARDNDLIGNEVRVFVGYDSLTYSEYERVFTGYVASVDIGESTMRIAIADRRKQLTRAIQISVSAQNPVTTIQNILTDYFNATYDTDYFDTTEWAQAISDVDDDGLTVTLDMQDPEPAIDVIEGLCVAAAGVFYVNADNQYSFRQNDPDASAAFTVLDENVLNPKNIRYDSTDVISSIRVGYARDWDTSASTFTSATEYTWYTDDTHEGSVFSAYQTYNQREYPTYLDTLSAATSWASLVYPWHTDVHGTVDIDVPMSHFSDAVITEIGNIQINRPQQTMLGTVGTEIKSISWNLDRIPTITLGVRFT